MSDRKLHHQPQKHSYVATISEDEPEIPVETSIKRNSEKDAPLAKPHGMTNYHSASSRNPPPTLPTPPLESEAVETPKYAPPAPYAPLHSSYNILPAVIR